ncbi:IniB N-terminal domain-containing protein [Actinophytocola sp.]|uniref:IniB N-terminal domain-containing protein n=1 Tax=Actinophytocola sp. TaxID=1872138 RepID=UPI002ED36955
MASIAELIDFLMSLMRDDDTRAEFERNPDAALADRGLADVSGQDVRDARLMMTDTGAAHPRAGSRPDRNSGSDNDPVREIQHTTTHFEVGDMTTTVITVNDNDTVIVDSFNNDVVAIQDNDTTDVDVISIEDNDTVTPGDEEEEPAEDPAAGIDPALGEEPPEDLPETEEPDSGASEGFAPDPEPDLGAASDLGTEFTAEEPPADEPVDELVG